MTSDGNSQPLNLPSPPVSGMRESLVLILHAEGDGDFDRNV